MYQLVNLGLSIGMNISFFMWSLLFIGIILLIVVKRARLSVKEMLKQLLIKSEVVFKSHFLSFHATSGNQGLPIQPEIFKQNLTTRITSLNLKLRNLLKVIR